MVGMGLALLGGAAKGWSAGQLQNIKSTREEKLRQLELDRAERMEGQRQSFLREEGALNRASQEKLTGAQLAMNKSLAEMQRDTTMAVTKMGVDVDRERIGSSEKIAQLQTDNNQKIAQMQIDAANTPSLVQTKTGYAWVRKDGTTMEAPIDPATNKPLDPLVTKDDTPQIANYKFLSGLPGMTPAEAKRLSFDSKDNLKAAMGDFSTGNPTPEQQADVDARTKLNMDNWRNSKTSTPPASQPTTGSPGASGTPTAPGGAESTAAPDITFPPNTTEQQAFAWAKAQMNATPPKSRAAIKQVLKANHFDPTKVPGL
jgi:hypothetical protein